MRSWKKRRKPSSKIRRARLQLETLNPRLLLSISADWFTQQDWVEPDIPAEFIKSGYELPDVTYSDPTFWGPAQEYTADADFASPVIISITGDADEHSVACSCPACLGLSDVSQDHSQDDPFAEATGDEQEFPPADHAEGGYVLYLDFDGERVYSRIGDFWLGGNYVDIPAYDLSTFGWEGRENESIEYIAEFIREDYAAFNISRLNHLSYVSKV